MPVCILTDSISDLPPRIVQELGITVVPLRISFGAESYRDGVDLTADEFYEKLQKSPHFPTTSAPAPVDFAKAYDELAEQAGEVLAITLSAKLSGTYEAARQGRELVKKKLRVEVLDSQTAAMAEGLVVLKAAQAAREGASQEDLADIVQRTSKRVELLATFDTLEYLRRGGRIGAAKVFLGSLLKIHPLITVQDGLVKPAGRTRSRSKAVELLYEFAAGYSKIEELGVEYTVCAGEAEGLIDRLSALFPRPNIFRSQMTPVIGAHTGPGLLVVIALGDKKTQIQIRD